MTHDGKAAGLWCQERAILELEISTLKNPSATIRVTVRFSQGRSVLVTTYKLAAASESLI